MGSSPAHTTHYVPQVSLIMHEHAYPYERTHARASSPDTNMPYTAKRLESHQGALLKNKHCGPFNWQIENDLGQQLFERRQLLHFVTKIVDMPQKEYKKQHSPSAPFRVCV